MKTSFWYCRGKQITLWNDAVYDNRLIKLEKFTVPIVKNKRWQRYEQSIVFYVLITGFVKKNVQRRGYGKSEPDTT